MPGFVWISTTYHVTCKAFTSFHMWWAFLTRFLPPQHRCILGWTHYTSKARLFCETFINPLLTNVTRSRVRERTIEVARHQKHTINTELFSILLERQKRRKEANKWGPSRVPLSFYKSVPPSAKKSMNVFHWNSGNQKLNSAQLQIASLIHNFFLFRQIEVLQKITDVLRATQEEITSVSWLVLGKSESFLIFILLN